MSKEEIILEHNKMIAEILTECNSMIRNRFCMNDIAIRRKAEKIMEIAEYYIIEPKEYRINE